MKYKSNPNMSNFSSKKSKEQLEIFFEDYSISFYAMDMGNIEKQLNNISKEEDFNER